MPYLKIKKSKILKNLSERNDVPKLFIADTKRPKAEFRDCPNVHVACGLMPSEFSKYD